MNNQNTFLPKNAAYFRARARESLKGNWGVAIGAMLLASICGAFLSGDLFNVDLKEFGINSQNLVDPSFYSAETLQSILSKFTATHFAVLLSVAAFGFFTTIAWRLFVGGAVYVGYQKFNLDLVDQNHPAIKTLFDPFRACYIKSVVLRLLLLLINRACLLPVIVAGGVSVSLCAPVVKAFLAKEAFEAGYYVMISVASLLLCLASIATSILSVIINLRYRYAAVILSEYPELSAVEALQKSRSLMQGNKWRLFCLELSFIGWYLLSALFTCCIGFIWAIPYANAAVIAFYDDIANRRAANEAEFPSLDPNDYTVQ